MIKEYFLLALWLLVLFGLIGVAIYFIFRAVRVDSFRYDELYVWRTKKSSSPKPDHIESARE